MSSLIRESITDPANSTAKPSAPPDRIGRGGGEGPRRHRPTAGRRWTVSGIVGAAILAVLVAVAVGGAALTGDPLAMNLGHAMEGPSLVHPMGTDEFGRDILSRVVHGARISLVAGVTVVAVSLGLGILLGIVAGYRGGIPALLLMGSVDLMLALPSVLVAIVIAALLSPKLSTAILAVAIVNVPYYARLVWGATQTVRLEEYVEAARAAGASDARIIWRHIVPGILPPSAVQATLGVGTGILTVSALSFLGLGAQPPTPEWGLMLSEAQHFVLNAPYMGIFPGVAIMVAVLGINLVGEVLRDRLDPRLSRDARQ